MAVDPCKEPTPYLIFSLIERQLELVVGREGEDEYRMASRLTKSLNALEETSPLGPPSEQILPSLSNASFLLAEGVSLIALESVVTFWHSLLDGFNWELLYITTMILPRKAKLLARRDDRVLFVIIHQ